MYTKTFVDNNRLVFVIEDCDEETKRKIYELLNPEEIPPVDAQSTTFAKFISKSDLNAIQMQEIGPHTDKSFETVAKQFKNGFVGEGGEDIRKLLNIYIGRRFANQDPFGTSSKFNDVHCRSFVEKFDFALDKVWEKSQLDKLNFNSYSLDDKRAFIASAIEFFANVGKMLRL